MPSQMTANIGGMAGWLGAVRKDRGRSGHDETMTPRSDPDAEDGDDRSMDAAFSDLFDSGFGDIWGYVRRRVGSRADADDVTAEVFAVAWRRRAELPALEERRLWLFGVAHNVVRNHHRSVFRQHRLAGRLADIRGPSVEPVDRDDAVWFALARMSEEDRELLLMRAWDGLAVTDIAAILGRTANAVSVRLSKARVRLRAELGEKDRKSAGHEVLNPARRGEADD